MLSLDSGGNYHGYIGDLARMAVLGEPDAELKDCLAEIEAVQRAAFAAVRPAPWAATSTSRPSGSLPRSRSATAQISWPTAWASSATRPLA